jgi:hypothetical protein
MVSILAWNFNGFFVSGVHSNSEIITELFILLQKPYLNIMKISVVETKSGFKCRSPWIFGNGYY